MRMQSPADLSVVSKAIPQSHSTRSRTDKISMLSSGGKLGTNKSSYKNLDQVPKMSLFGAARLTPAPAPKVGGGKQQPLVRKVTQPTDSAVRKQLQSPVIKYLSPMSRPANSKVGTQLSLNRGNAIKTDRIPIRREDPSASILSARSGGERKRSQDAHSRPRSPVPAGGGLIPKSQEYLKKAFEL